ncbi:MAG: hypothetical protein WC489_08625 [Patescibacteria group bacterium]
MQNVALDAVWLPPGTLVRIVIAGTLGGFAIGFLLFPLLIWMLAPGTVNVVASFVGSFILAIPCMYLGGWIYKKIENYEDYESLYVAVILVVCLLYLVISVGFWI